MDRNGLLVEGTNPHLFTQLIRPDAPPIGRPVLLLHGFASSSRVNWEDSGWISALTGAGRTVLTVDLPGHGRSSAPADRDSYRPSRIRADLLQLLLDAGVVPLAGGNPGSGVDIVGYSLGSRLAWEFGATQPELVHRMVLGGPGTADPLAAFDLAGARRILAGEAVETDPQTADLLAIARRAMDGGLGPLFTMIEAMKEEPFSPQSAIPPMPLLLVAGDNDPLAATAPELAGLSLHAEVVALPGRTHVDAVTSRAFKNAAIDFLSYE